MTKLISNIKAVSSSSILLGALLGIFAAIMPELVAAQFYGGPGIVGGITHAEAIGGVTGQEIRQIVLSLLLAVLLFMGLAAVVVIVIAGIWLVVSVGDEQAKEKAKKIILYALVGLIIIALAAGIVTLIINATGGGGIFGPVPTLGNADGTDIRATVRRILRTVLGFMALIAVIVIVIAGISMVISLGNEQAKDRAKRIILYTIIGLFIILLARALVGLIDSTVMP
ncbi:MAG: hypothetical protein QF793_03460 [Candidatus Peribacteraceae bacterium]|jgi:hypothetical protein|nr:hypothetical protein [bacterium]MDP6561957.1 hypothetical protein [Candidatus Peribacteraceae bacterium]|tara:strand:- start:34132 stop:34809 length:678 start_codon:yes stop_codon:yes gene_type:complete